MLVLLLSATVTPELIGTRRCTAYLRSFFGRRPKGGAYLFISYRMRSPFSVRSGSNSWISSQ